MGLVQIGIGLFLICHDTLFQWPPGVIATVANDDIIGFSMMLIGVGFIWWVLDNQRSIRWDHILLTASGGFFFVLTVYQYLHWCIMGMDMPWISNAALTAIIMILAARSDSGAK